MNSHTQRHRITPSFRGTRGRVLALLCEADDRLSGGQIASMTNSSRSTAHGVMAELVHLGIASRTDYPSVTMFELGDNAVARAIDTLHDRRANAQAKIAAVKILRHVLPQWAEERDELASIASEIFASSTR